MSNNPHRPTIQQIKEYLDPASCDAFVNIIQSKDVKILFLDDNAQRTKYFLNLRPEAIVKDMADSIIEEINRNPDSYVFLDHDLDGRVYVPTHESNTGSEVVRYICKNKPKIKGIVCHSMNEKACREMVHNLRQNGYKAYFVPWEFLTMIVDTIEK